MTCCKPPRQATAYDSPGYELDPSAWMLQIAKIQYVNPERLG